MKKTAVLALPFLLAFLATVAIMAAACGRTATVLPAAITIVLFGVLSAAFRGLVGFAALAFAALSAWRDNRRAWSALIESERDRAPCSCALPSPPFASQDGRLFCLLCRREARAVSEASR